MPRGTRLTLLAVLDVDAVDFVVYRFLLFSAFSASSAVKASSMRILGLDLGERRVGVAVSDPDGIIAHPLEQFEPRGRRDLVAKVAALVAREKAERVVVGHPVLLDGTVGEQARRTEAVVKELRKVLPVPVVVWDERFTTADAEEALRQAEVPPGRRRDKRDMIAATLILRAYLEAGAP